MIPMRKNPAYLLTALTEVPGALKKFYPDLAELKAEIAIYAENSHRNDCLMAKMLTQLTTAEAAEVKAEIKGISNSMNAKMRNRLGSDVRNIEAVLGMMMLGELIMTNSPDSPLTVEQLAILRGTGIYEELLKAGE